MAVFRYSGNWRSYLEGSSSTVGQDKVGNTSVVKVDVWIGMEAGWSIEFGNTYGNVVDVTCDGQTKTIAVGALSLNGSKKYLGSVQFTVTHNPEGVKTASIRLSSNMSNISYGSLVFGNASGSWPHTLPTIYRASTVASVSGAIGSSVTVNISRQATSFTHTVRYAWGSKSGTIATGVGTSATWTIPMDFANDVQNATSGKGTIYVDTYSGSTKIGTTSNTLTASVPASVKPTFTGVTLSDTNTAVQALLASSTTFLQIISNIKVAFNGASGTYGSSITGYKAEIVGKNQTTNANGGTLGMMNYNGTATVRASVVDSRGRWSDTKDVTITVLEYFSPILTFGITRSGTTLSTFTVNRNAKIAPITVSGSQKNTMTLSFKVAPIGTTNYTADTGPASGTWTSLSSLTNSQANLAGAYVADKSFIVVGTLSDKFTNAEFSFTVSTEAVIESVYKNGSHAYGKVVDTTLPAGSLEAVGNIYASNMFIAGKALRDIFYPVGSIFQSTNATSPATFIGGTWERFGNGRVLVGVDETDGDFNAPNKTGGTKTHTLTIEEIPPHTHTLNGWWFNGTSNKPSGNRYGMGYQVEGASFSQSTRSTENNWFNSPTGGGRAHNNMQPYITIYMWKRTA